MQHPYPKVNPQELNKQSAAYEQEREQQREERRELRKKHPVNDILFAPDQDRAFDIADIQWDVKENKKK